MATPCEIMYGVEKFSGVMEKLQAPTPPEVVRWIPRVLWTKKEPHSALAFPTTNARFTQERLDEAAGAGNWQVKATVIGGLLVVGIGLRDPFDPNAWVWKYDTGQDDELLGNGDSDMRKAGRGVYSIGMRRAGVQWGIARDVYYMPTPRLKIATYQDKRGNYRFSRWLDPLPGMRKSGSEAVPVRKDRGENGQEGPEDGGEAAPPEADHNTYYKVAYSKLSLDREQALGVLADHTDGDTGEIDYGQAIMALESQLPEDERTFTKATKILQEGG